METITTKLVKATPRSKYYNYFVGAGSSYSMNSSENQNSEIEIKTVFETVDNYSELLDIEGETNHLYLVLYQTVLYYFDEDTSTYKPASGAVKKLVAGSNVTISPSAGTGEVTINADGAVKKIVAGSNVTINPTTGTGEVTINAASPGVTSIVAGNYITISPTTGTGAVTVSVDLDSLKTALGL